MHTTSFRPAPGVRVGEMARDSGGKRYALQVMESAAGFYLGTRDEDGCPYSRESLEYWPDRTQAEAAMTSGEWTQRDEP